MHRMLKPAFLLVAAACLLPACAETKVPEDLGASLRGAQADLNDARASVASTTSALKDVRDNRGSNVAPQFKAFTDNLASLELKVGGAQGSREITQEKAAAFFDKWEQQINQIQDRDVAESARERQKDVMASFQKLKDKVHNLRDAYRIYYSNCVDVRNTMTTDMTSSGAAIARPAMNAAIDQSPVVLDRIDDVNKTIDRMVGM